MSGTFEVPFAADEQGRWCAWPIGSGHLLACGTTGAGKSSIPRAVVAYAAPSPEVQFVGVDLKAVELQQYGRRLSALAVERDEAAQVLGEVVEIMARRKSIAARNGWTKWPASPRHPFLAVLVDELAEVTTAAGLPKPIQAQAETAAGHLDRIGRLGRALGIGLLACTQRGEASVVGGSLRSLFAYRFSLAALDVGSHRMALGLADGVDLAHLTSGLSIDRPGCGLWLDPSHPTVRVARVAWWSDVTVAGLMHDHANFTVPLAQLVQWVAEDAADREAVA